MNINANATNTKYLDTSKYGAGHYYVYQNSQPVYHNEHEHEHDHEHNEENYAAFNMTEWNTYHTDQNDQNDGADMHHRQSEDEANNLYHPQNVIKLNVSNMKNMRIVKEKGNGNGNGNGANKIKGLHLVLPPSSEPDHTMDTSLSAPLHQKLNC